MKKSHSRKKTYIVFAVVLLLILHITGILNPAEAVVARALNPLLGEVYAFSSALRIRFNEQTSKVDLQNEVTGLQAEVNRLTVANADLTVAQEENQVLRQHLNFLQKNNYRYVMSNVISRGDVSDLSDRTETIEIDKGSRDGVTVGLPVVSSEGIIIGKVSDVKGTVANVYLTNNKNCQLAATVLNDDKTSGITQGDLGLTIKMQFIPQDKVLSAGETIVTSGMETNIPRGLVIGKISTVHKVSNDVWQEAVIEPMVDYDTLTIVSVLLPQNN